MAILVADVGGTNARLALAQDGRLLPATIARFRGEDHADFSDVLRLFLHRQGLPSITSVCVAVAGPVQQGRAQLTNRAWRFDEADLRHATGAPRAQLINDMIALGHAVSATAKNEARPLRPPVPAPVHGALPANQGQKLVVNAGTGFNVCAVSETPGKTATCLEAEEGHASLPLSVWRVLQTHCPDSAQLDEFSTNETLFCGRGLVRLHRALHGGPACRAEDVVHAATADASAAGVTLELFARMFGLLCGDLALRFMPRNGVYIAGSVARSAVRDTQIFLPAFDANPVRATMLPNIPIAVIENDLAALEGCLSVAS